MQLQNVETSKRIDPYRKCSEKRVDVLISNKYNKYNAQTNRKTGTYKARVPGGSAFGSRRIGENIGRLAESARIIRVLDPMRQSTCLERLLEVTLCHSNDTPTLSIERNPFQAKNQTLRSYRLY